MGREPETVGTNQHLLIIHNGITMFSLESIYYMFLFRTYSLTLMTYHHITEHQVTRHIQLKSHKSSPTCCEAVKTVIIMRSTVY